MSTTLVLLSPIRLSLRNTLTVPYVIKRLPIAVVALAVWYAIYLGAFYLSGFLRSVEPVGEMLSLKMLSVVFLALSAFLLLSALITALSAFYLAKDLPLLLPKPIRPDALLTARAVQTWVGASWMAVAFTPPMLVGYGVQYGAHWQFYAASIALIVPFTLVPTGLGIIGAHLLARMFPAGRARGLMMGLGLVGFMLFYFAIKGQTAHRDDGIEALLGVLMRIRTDSPLMPGYWMQQSLWPLLTGGKADWLFPGLMITSAGVAMLAAHGVGLRLHQGTLYLMGNAAVPRVRGIGPRVPTSGARAFFWKDMRIFFRDTEQWSQLAVIGSLLAVYLNNFWTLPMGALRNLVPAFDELSAAANLLLAGMVLAAVAARFVYVGVSVEGGAFWVVRSAPIAMRQFLASKYLYGLVPLALLMGSIVLLSGLLLGQAWWLLVLSVVTMLALCASVTALAVGLGARYPKFHYESIAYVSMGLGGVTFMALAFFLVVVTVGLVGAGVYYYMQDAALIKTICLGALAIALNVLAAVLPMRMGARWLSGDSWEQ